MESIKSCSTTAPSQQDREIETAAAFICARAGAAYVGTQKGFGSSPDLVLFQAVVTTLALPLSEFANDPEKAATLIKQKLAAAGYSK
jgi:hypothetical protein